MLTVLNIMWTMLVIVSILFLISGLDGLFFDVFYWSRYSYRIWKTRKYPVLTYQDLALKPQQKIAIVVPCWHEHEVIGEMLRYNVSGIDYDNYDFFIGVYPNDPKTIEAVKEAHELYPHIQYLIGPNPGPTTKADNLNSLFKFIIEYERRNGTAYDIIVMHDSEDVIHPLSLLYYNYLLPRKNMIQLPVFPLEVPWWQFTHWVYNDEFAENHTKDIIVREAIKGLVPSAGVSTGFSRATINILASVNNGLPFSTSSFTEDYDTALRINLRGLKGIFVFQKIKVTRMKESILPFGKPKLEIHDEIVAARSLFPTRYTKAIRQKARWIMGISFQEWANVGWKGSWSTKYTLLHDRKTVLTHFVNVLGYIIFLFWFFYYYWQRYNPIYPTLQEFFDKSPWVWVIIVICTVIMIERLIQRAIAVYRVYGLVPAIMSVPRAVYGNFINMHALLRAYKQFFFASRKKGKVWDKTEHTFPTSSQLKRLRPKLGSLLLTEGIVSADELRYYLVKQRLTGRRLGDLLMEESKITQEQLTKYLAIQENLEFISAAPDLTLSVTELPLLLKNDYKWLMHNDVLPIQTIGDELVVAIPDPMDKGLQAKIIKKVKPLNVQFVVYSKET